MDNPFQQQGAFSWCELMTTDLQGAEEFYKQLFGWTFEDGPVDGIEYRVISAGGQQVGGIAAMPAGMQQNSPIWGTYVTVENVDAAAQMAETLGGRVLMPPRDIPNVGKFALIQDPQGAVISAITYSSPN
ncbi:VOC family protein [Altericista sp. CCNU0014]|uniref:VOC family protein n=1 Tax=Altericista sp. CCNU0014 TaxID=3082949 RepID=UPI00384C4AAA